ncbi:MAG: SDR family NAD(P)-dependent oxidoreductase, partial [Acidobacteriota bacterium]|nr:SDR family NAD(P)-dependent oxidoreductase [Acidobacteriota bacterium]
SKLADGLDLNDVEFESRPYSASAAYAQSKQANRMLTWALARRLKGTNVTANAMSPGPVDTSLLRTLAPGLKGRTTGEGADTVIWLATSPEVTNLTNRFWIDRREEPCQFRNVAQEEALWAICEGMTRKATSAVPA